MVAPTATQTSTQFSDDTSSSKSIVPRFPRVPSFNGTFFSRDRPSSPAFTADSPLQESRRPSLGVVTNSPQAPVGRHCPTCQCWRHTSSTQNSYDYPSPSTPAHVSPPPSPFKAVFPGVLLYVPEDQHSSARPPSPTASSIYSGYFRDTPSSPDREMAAHSRASRV